MARPFRADLDSPTLAQCLTEGELIVLRKLLLAVRRGERVLEGVQLHNQMRAFNSLERKAARRTS